MLDGYVIAIVAGPVWFDPREWICPLLVIDADAFNRSGSLEFAAISAVAMHHNDISNILSAAPDRFESIHRCSESRRRTHPPSMCQPRQLAVVCIIILQSELERPLISCTDLHHPARVA
jgi:uncharacterized protein